jgi:large subunit ribosomal protein L9
MGRQTEPATKRPRGGFRRLPKGPHGGIELLLIQSVEHLGKHGDVVEVKRGHAFNYLIPEGLATIATDHHKRMVDKHKARLVEIERTKLKGLQAEADRIARLSLTIEANANDDGHLYGSVGASEIHAALKAHDVHVGKDQIKMEGVLKELGLYTLKVRLHQDIEADLKVWVVPTATEESVRKDEAATE